MHANDTYPSVSITASRRTQPVPPTTLAQSLDSDIVMLGGVPLGVAVTAIVTEIGVIASHRGFAGSMGVHQEGDNYRNYLVHFVRHEADLDRLPQRGLQ